MSLDDLLKNVNESEANKLKQQKEKEARNKIVKDTFQECFDTIINPAITEIIDTFQKNKFEAYLGQGIKQTSYNNSLKALSVTIPFLKHKLQVDIIANELTKKIDFISFFNTPFNKENTTNSWSIEEVDKQKTDVYFQWCVNKLQTMGL